MNCHSQLVLKKRFYSLNSREFVVATEEFVSGLFCLLMTLESQNWKIKHNLLCVPMQEKQQASTYRHMCCRLWMCLNRDTGLVSCTLIGPCSGRRWRKNKYLK